MRPGTDNSTLTRGYGTLAGMGIIGAAILAVPSTLLLDPRPDSEAYLATVAGLVTGLVCISLPWERMDPRWLHLIGFIATVEAAWAVAVFGQAYTAFFFVIAVAAAYVTPDPRSLLSHLGLIGVAIFSPVFYGPEDAQSTIQIALVAYPLLVLTAGIFAYLRQRMVADHLSYRLFAEETLALANRIAGRPLTAQRSALAEDIEELPALSRFHLPARLSAAVALVLSLPLLTAGLAAAGVKLPAFASDTLGEIGIELPNQDPAVDGAKASTRSPDWVGDPGAGNPGEGGAGSTSGAGAHDPAGSRLTEKDDLEGTGLETGPVAGGSSGSGEPPSASQNPDGGGQPDGPGAQGSGDGAGHGGLSLGDALEDTLTGLGGLLGGKGRPAPEEEPPPKESSAEGRGDRFAGAGDEVDERRGQDPEEDGGERCGDAERDDDAAADPEACPAS